MTDPLLFLIDHWPWLVVGGFAWLGGGLLIAALIELAEAEDTQPEPRRRVRGVR